MAAGTLCIFACGLSWLTFFVPTNAILPMGLYPFVPGAAIKLAVAAIALPTVCRFVGRER
jgi:biotin transport system substrate-specific component